MTQIYVPGACSVAVKCKDGVVLGNDNRVIWGYTVTNKNTKKVFPLTKNIGMTCYGLVGDFQNIVKILIANANIYEFREGVPITVKAMAKLVANMLYQRKMAPYYVNLAIAGIDEGGPQVWTMDAIGSLMPDDFATGGSAATMAVGILEVEYNPEMTVEQGIKLVEKTVRAAVKRDATTGNGIDILAITKDGCKELSFPITELGG